MGLCGLGLEFVTARLSSNKIMKRWDLSLPPSPTFFLFLIHLSDPSLPLHWLKHKGHLRGRVEGTEDYAALRFSISNYVS